MAEVAGEAYFFNFPKITDAKDLGNHIDEWLEYMNLYGLTMDDKHLRVMLAQTLRPSIQEEISTPGSRSYAGRSDRFPKHQDEPAQGERTRSAPGQRAKAAWQSKCYHK